MTDPIDPQDEPAGEDAPNEVAHPPEYVYDAAHAALAGPLLTASVTGLRDIFDLARTERAPALKAALGDAGLHREFIALGLYRIELARGDGAAGGTIEPLEEPDKGWSLVRPILNTSEDVRNLWEDLSAIVTEPALVSRLHDLCFSARHGAVGTHGRAAVDAYLQLPSTDLNPRYVSEGIVRAWTLARMMNNDALKHATFAAAHHYATKQIVADGDPGTVLPLLNLLCAKVEYGTAPVDAADTAGLLADALGIYQPSYLRVQIAGLMRQTATTDTERVTADRVEVQAHLDQAQRSAKLAKVFHLRSAAQTARDLGVKDLEDQAIAELQGNPIGRSDLAHIRTAMGLPIHFIGSILRPFDEANDWRGALHQFLHTPCPAGSYENNVKQAKQSLRRSTLRGTIPGFSLGIHGLPEQSTNTPEEQLEAEATMLELIEVDMRSRMLARGLQRMPSVYGLPDSDEIVAFLMDAYRCDEGMAASFATSLRLFWQGEYSASVHLSVPRIEQGVRRLLLLLNEPVYRVEQGKKIGQFPGLGALLPLLVDEGFDRDWERYIGALLLPRGRNLRNLLAHGFVDDISPGHAAAALRASGLMTLIAPAADVSDDPQTIRQNLNDPLALASAYRRLHPVQAILRRTARLVRNRLGHSHLQT